MLLHILAYLNPFGKKGVWINEMFSHLNASIFALFLKLETVHFTMLFNILSNNHH